MDKINIDINLSGQEEGKFRALYLVLGISGIIWMTVTLIFPELGLRQFYFTWIVFLPGFMEAILYGLGKKRMFGDNFPYLRINDERIEKSKGGFFASPEVTYWTEIKSIEIKLFELEITTDKNERKSVDLNSLTDDNLKIVKEYVASLKKSKGL